jgi:hypothetical protein
MNNLEIIQKYSGRHRRQHSKKKILSIINIFKRYKITDFTRPIELGTMTNKVATRNPVDFGSAMTTCS